MIMFGTPPKRWLAVIVGVVSVAVVVLDFFTKAIGIIDVVSEWIAPPLIPSVSLRPVAQETSGECLEFAFTDLPEDFVLGDIHLQIVETSVLSPFSGDMAARVVERIVHKELSLEIFRGKGGEIVLPVRIESEKNGDVAYVDYCPILSSAGTRGWIRVVPLFFSPSGELIENIRVVIQDGEEGKKGVAIDISRPKNTVISLVEPTVRVGR